MYRAGAVHRPRSGSPVDFDPVAGWRRGLRPTATKLAAGLGVALTANRGVKIEKRDTPCQGCSHFVPPRPSFCSFIRGFVLARRSGHGSLNAAFGSIPGNWRSWVPWSAQIGLPESVRFIKAAYLPQVEERNQK